MRAMQLANFAEKKILAVHTNMKPYPYIFFQFFHIFNHFHPRVYSVS